MIRCLHLATVTLQMDTHIYPKTTLIYSQCIESDCRTCIRFVSSQNHRVACALALAKLTNVLVRPQSVSIKWCKRQPTQQSYTCNRCCNILNQMGIAKTHSKRQRIVNSFPFHFIWFWYFAFSANKHRIALVVTRCLYSFGWDFNALQWGGHLSPCRFNFDLYAQCTSKMTSDRVFCARKMIVSGCVKAHYMNFLNLPTD